MNIKGKLLGLLGTTFLLLFFIFIMTFIWYTVLPFDTLSFSEVITHMSFWFVNDLILLFVILGQFLAGSSFPFPFRTAIIIMTVLYTLIECLLFGFGLFTLPSSIYIILNLVLLFIYLLIIVPIYIKGAINK